MNAAAVVVVLFELLLGILVLFDYMKVLYSYLTRFTITNLNERNPRHKLSKYSLRSKVTS